MKNSTYIIAFHHDEYWPFYDVKHRFGRVILTINTAHPFFTDLYDPVRKMGMVQTVADSDEVAVVPTEAQPGPLSSARSPAPLARKDAEQAIEH